MRVITGTARGRKLTAPEGLDTRPTSEAVKEAIFSAIQFEIEGRTAADLFAGSGQIGIEALSRGAKKVYFTDNNQASVETIKKNTAALDFTEKAVIHSLPAAAFLRTVTDNIDIAFLDPPYGHKYLEKTLPVLAEKMSSDGIIICEHEKELALPETVGNFKVKKVYRYGKTSVTIYRNKEIGFEESDDE